MQTPIIKDTIQQITLEGLPLLQFRSFLYDGLQHAIFTRQGGVSQPPHHTLNLSTAVNDHPPHVHENRRRAFAAFGQSHQTLVHAQLVHKADVAVVTAEDHGRILPAVDALITNQPHCGLTMNYADCAPILLYDPRQHAIGLGHAGWMGTVADIPGAMVRAMQTTYGTHPPDLIAAIGPCIHLEQYEVDEPLVSAVRRAFPHQANQLLIPQTGKTRPHFDLPRANHYNLQKAGVTHIHTAPFSTAARTDLFFSHRAENGLTGRFGVLLRLTPR